MADPIGIERFLQDDELPDVLVLRHHAFERHLVLELIEVRGRGDDRIVDPHDVEPRAIPAGLVLGQDDSRRAVGAAGVGLIARLVLLHPARGIDEGVVRRRRNAELLVGANFLERVGHYSPSPPKPPRS